MNHEGFRLALRRLSLSHEAAALKLGADQPQVVRWEEGRDPIPPEIGEKLQAMLDKRDWTTT